jgi:hypothetical protein
MRSTKYAASTRNAVVGTSGEVTCECWLWSGLSAKPAGDRRSDQPDPEGQRDDVDPERRPEELRGAKVAADRHLEGVADDRALVRVVRVRQAVEQPPEPRDDGDHDHDGETRQVPQATAARVVGAPIGDAPLGTARIVRRDVDGRPLADADHRAA